MITIKLTLNGYPIIRENTTLETQKGFLCTLPEDTLITIIYEDGKRITEKRGNIFELNNE
jgi:hypothetical protein